jgi:hypothetical protein
LRHREHQRVAPREPIVGYIDCWFGNDDHVPRVIRADFSDKFLGKFQIEAAF